MKSLILKPALFPVSLLIQLVLIIRHYLYDRGILRSTKFSDVAVVAIGNLSMGGTGKTPMTEFLAEHLVKSFNVAVLSRGYGRKTKGFRWVHPQSHYFETGDEPLLIKRNFPELPVAVCERRVEGVKKILQEKPDRTLILLDDALQHRQIIPAVAILLTTWHDPFTDDYLVPAGTLRDLRSRAKNVDVILVTKSPVIITTQQRAAFERKISKYSDAPVFFARSVNSIFYPHSGKIAPADVSRSGILITTLANPLHLRNYLEHIGIAIAAHKAFRDHQPISESMWMNILEMCMSENSICYMTEKEWVKVPEKLKSKYPDMFGIVKVRFEIENNKDFINVILTKIYHEKNYSNFSNPVRPAGHDRIC